MSEDEKRTGDFDGLNESFNEYDDTPWEGGWQKEAFNPALGIGIGTEGEYYAGYDNEQKYDFYSDVSLHRQMELRLDFHYQPASKKTSESEENLLTLELEGLYNGREPNTNYTKFGATFGGDLPIDTDYPPLRFARANATKNPVDRDGDGINEILIAGQIGISTLRWLTIPIPENIQGDIYFATSLEITPEEWKVIDHANENIEEVFDDVVEVANLTVDHAKEVFSDFQDWVGDVSSSASEHTESALDRIQQAYNDLTSIMG